MASDCNLVILAVQINKVPFSKSDVFLTHEADVSKPKEVKKSLSAVAR